MATALEKIELELVKKFDASNLTIGICEGGEIPRNQLGEKAIRLYIIGTLSKGQTDYCRYRIP